MELLKERQEDEIEVLKSLFNEDFIDLRKKDAWKVDRPPEIRLALVPLQSMHIQNEICARIDLVVKCTEKYPDEVPAIILENSNGLHKDTVTQLRLQLVELANKSKGEVMIYDLAQHVQKVLHEYNKPAPKSFYEEMMTNKKKQEEKLEKEQQKRRDLLKRKEDKERQKIEEEIQKRQEELREETRRQKEARQASKTVDIPGSPSIPLITRSSSFSPSPPSAGSHRPRRGSESSSLTRRKRQGGTPASDRRSSEEDIMKASITFHGKNVYKVVLGKSFGQQPNGCMTYTGMDVESGSVVTVSEWILKWKSGGRKITIDEDYTKEESKYLKEVNHLETEFSTLATIQHGNVLSYLGLRYFTERGKITIQLLKEYVGESSIDMHLKDEVPIPLQLLQYYTKELLHGLSFLHDKAITHKDLKASCIYLDKHGHLKIADYSLEKRISDLHEAVECARPGVHFSQNDDNKPFILGRSSKKADVYQLGILLLSLAVGHNISEKLPDVPDSLPVNLQDFLKRCLMKDERLRWSTSQLLEHDFLKPAVSHGLLPVKNVLNLATGIQQKEASAKLSDSDENLPKDVPLFISYDSSGQSRLTTEFETLEWLGKGGFGDVIKVCNRLDGRNYAIKRILLNPKSKQFNRKITREVKLLSRLNHENVVRYYNSWIETSVEPQEESSSSSDSTRPSISPKTGTSKKNCAMMENSLGLVDNINSFMVPPAPLDDTSVEWNISTRLPAIDSSSISDDGDDDEDEDFADVFGTSFMNLDFEEESESIIFDKDGIMPNESKLPYDETGTSGSLPSKQEASVKVQFLYIQMEFCEKSTLRQVIDAGLYDDMARVWRLFREIIEGLVHIHEQGMIHRDLKPVNIFLDSNGHVKIGDFGLATTEIIAKTSMMDAALLQLSAPDSVQSGSSKSFSVDDSNLTGKVGTALYVSPEMMKTTARMNYTQKVDIYSLGIIFFEMCYHPLPTGMERVKVLSNLRQSSIDFPEDFDDVELSDQAHIINWLLNHNFDKRPTSQELLQSDYLPPPQMEEAELYEVLRSAISNPQSKSYKHMIGAMLSQPVTVAFDYMYDDDTHTVCKMPCSSGSSMIQRYVLQLLENIFQRHGAIKINTPLLLPKSETYEHSEGYVCLMERSGGLVSLPYDLRVPFARYIAKNNISFVKRYHISTVYREKKLYGLHPRELAEAAFDIVTPNVGNLIPDAEVIHVIQEIVSEIPVLQNNIYYLRINHTSLVRAVLLYCAIEEEKFGEVLSILSDSKVEKNKKLLMHSRLQNLSLSEQTVSMLMNFVETDGPFVKVASMLRCITKTKGQAGSLAKKGLHELETMTTNASHMGVKLQITLYLGLLYNIQLYSGPVFQVVTRAVGKKRKGMLDVLAVGGRYDNLITKFSLSPSPGVTSHTQSAVGMSMAVDKIIAAVVEDTGGSELPLPKIYDVLVCSVGHRLLTKDQLYVTRELWAVGISTHVLYDSTQSLEEIQDFCRENGVSHLVILKDGDGTTVRVKSLDKDKITEKKMLLHEVVEYVQGKLLSYRMDTNEVISNSVTKQGAPNHQSGNEVNQTSASSPSINITFIMPETNSKMASNSKRKLESQIHSKISTVLLQLSSKTKIEVLSLDFDGKVLRTMAACLDLDNKVEYESSLVNITEKHQRHRKYLIRIFDSIRDLKFGRKTGFTPVIILYGQKDDSCRIVF